MSDQASGDAGYIVTPDGSAKKPSLFGKLKDKTKKAGSRIKSKVKKNPEDGSPVDHDGEEEEDEISDEAPSPTASQTTSTPRDFESEPSRFSGAKDQSEIPDVSGLSINEPTSTPHGKSYEEPSFNVPTSTPHGKSYEEPSFNVPTSTPHGKSYEEPSFNEPTSTPQGKSYEESSFNEPKSYEPAPPRESFQDSFQEPPQESYQKASQGSYQEPSQGLFQKPSQDSYQEPSQGSYQDPSLDSYKEPSQDSYQEPSQGSSATEKASGVTKGAKDAVYGGAAAAAGALGYDAYKKHDQEKPVTDKASDATSDFSSKAGEVGDRGYDAATGTKDSVAEQTKNIFGLSGSEPSATDKAAETTGAAQSKASETTDAAGSKAYEAKDAAQSKAADVNNATGDSETYTQKATNIGQAANNATGDSETYTQKATNIGQAANNATGDSETYTQKATNIGQAAKESAAGALGLGAAAEGPSLFEKAKRTAGFDSVPADAPLNEQAQSKAAEATDTTQSKAQETKDAAGYKAQEAKDAVGAKAADVNNATDDSQTYTQKAGATAQTAKDSATEALGLNKTSEGPSLVEKAKQSTGFDNTQGPSVVDTAKQNLASTVDNTKGYAANATAAAQDYTNQAKNTAVDTATPKQDDKALSEKITETLGALPARAQQTAASVTQSAKTNTSGAATDAHSGDPASPGILGKLGGLFGYGAKVPEHHDAAITGAHTTPTTTTTTTPPTQ